MTHTHILAGYGISLFLLLYFIHCVSLCVTPLREVMDYIEISWVPATMFLFGFCSAFNWCLLLHATAGRWWWWWWALVSVVAPVSLSRICITERNEIIASVLKTKDKSTFFFFPFLVRLFVIASFSSSSSSLFFSVFVIFFKTTTTKKIKKFLNFFLYLWRWKRNASWVALCRRKSR